MSPKPMPADGMPPAIPTITINLGLNRRTIFVARTAEALVPIIFGHAAVRDNAVLRRVVTLACQYRCGSSASDSRSVHEMAGTALSFYSSHGRAQIMTMSAIGLGFLRDTSGAGAAGDIGAVIC